MRMAAAVLAAIGLVTVPLGADGRDDRKDRTQGIPAGHLPRPGECRVWYDGVPPGRQPRPTNCRDAERVASRDRDARVIYGDARDGRDDARWERNDDDRWDRDDDDRWERDDENRRRGRPKAIPRGEGSGYPYPNGYPSDRRSPNPDRNPNRRGGYGYNRVPYDNGFNDGADKGRADVRSNHAYDPMRHGRYKSADRGYDRRYGSKDEYRDAYRQGFRAGYDETYRDSGTYPGDRRDSRRGGFRLPRFPWPF